MPFGIGFPELVIVGVVAVLLFGSRLPEVARSLGQSYQQFRKGLNEIQSSIQVDIDPPRYSNQQDRYRDVVDDMDPPPISKIPPPPEDE